jgi:signal transduction histidine kinase
METPLHVLAVEDSAEDVELLVRHLRKGGRPVECKRVESAGDLKAALDAGEWDVVISDYQIPGFGGLEALRMVRERGPEPPFLFLSGTIGEETAVEAMRMGAQDYLMKDNMARLLPAIEREMQQAELRRSQRQMEQRMRQLEKFEALGRLAGGIAHDFNNVIGAILGWAELGAKQLTEGSSCEAFEQIRQQAERATGLARQLLAFARRQVIEPANVDMNYLVGETVSLLQKLAGEQVEITLLLAPDLKRTRADRSQIEQVLINLCVNARDAMPEGGTLRIETRNVRVGDTIPASSNEAAPGQYVQLSVTDNGTGIEPGTLEKIFEPFFTTKEEGRGTGLGLATALGIVKQHNGFIDVKSTSGMGSTFHVLLPACEEAAEPVPAEKEPALRGGAETILVAEDHEGIREMVRELLQTLGYRVLEARNGEEAVALFTQHEDEIALVVLDVAMPKLEGPQAYDAICQMKPNVPAIFTSGYFDERVAAASQQATVLEKPYPPKVLGRKVRELLDSTAN